MTTKNELVELLVTVERLRKEKYPELPEGLVAQIIRLEDQYFDERTLVQRNIERLIDNQVSQGIEE